MLLKLFIIYLSFLAIYSTTDTQQTNLNSAMNVTKGIAHKGTAETEGNIQRKGRDNSPEQKHEVEAKPVNQGQVSPPLLKAQITLPKPKSMQIPLNFVVDSKPQAVPTKSPLLIKTGNAVPVPGHYVRLRADPKRKTISAPKTELNVGLQTPHFKVVPKDKVTTKSTNTRKNKFKSFDFSEADTNIESLPPAPKQTITRKNKRPEHINDPLDIKGDLDNENNTDVVHLKNATHMIRISKISEHEGRGSIPKVPNEVKHNQKSHEEVNHEITATKSLDTLEPPVIKQEEVNVAMFITNDGLKPPSDNKIDALKPREPPIIAQYSDDDSHDIITITNHNYEEVEERHGTYPEAPNFVEEEENQPLATPSWNTPASELYNNYLQNYQNAYNEYLRYISETNPTVYKKGNCYPKVPDSEGPSDVSQVYPSVNEGRSVQDVYYGRKPEGLNNVIDVRPENNLGRIWRTWKDTEIRISKPNLFNNKLGDLGRNFNDYSDMLPKAPSRPLFGTPAINLNGYYDNLNNPAPYQYSYPPYRYML